MTPSNKTNTNIILHKKLLNTYNIAKSKPSLNSESFLNEKVHTTPTIEPKIKNEKTEKKTKSINLARDSQKTVKKHVLLSTVKQFDILRPLLAKLNVKKIKNIFKRLKLFKQNKKHIFFYFKNDHLLLCLKGVHFKNGLLILKSLSNNRIKKRNYSKNMKNFYNLLLKN